VGEPATSDVREPAESDGKPFSTDQGVAATSEVGRSPKTGAYKIGNGVSAPAVLIKVEPGYSEEARQAKVQGTVLLSLVVDETGNPRDIRVVRPLGLGLDEKAVEAVAKWRFRPGLKDNQPVPVAAYVEVNFRLL